MFEIDDNKELLVAFSATMQLPGSMLTFFPVMVLGRFTAVPALLLGNPLRRYPADLLFLWMDAQKRENHLAFFTLLEI